MCSLAGRFDACGIAARSVLKALYEIDRDSREFENINIADL